MKVPSSDWSDQFEYVIEEDDSLSDLEDEQDFSEYLWMENEEEFDKNVILRIYCLYYVFKKKKIIFIQELQRLEEEELMKECIEAMLEDEYEAEYEAKYAEWQKEK